MIPNGMPRTLMRVTQFNKIAYPQLAVKGDNPLQKRIGLGIEIISDYAMIAMRRVKLRSSTHNRRPIVVFEFPIKVGQNRAELPSLKLVTH
jgi:hypothetical protein